VTKHSLNENSIGTVPSTAKVILIRPSLNPEDLFQELYLKYYERIKKYALKHLPDSGTEEDIVQDVFLKLWCKRETIQAIISPKHYLFKMATNQILDYKKRHSRIQQTQNNFESFTINQDELSSQEVIYREKRLKVEAAICHLLPRMKIVFILKLEGYKLAEIATCMGITKRTVTNQMNSACQNLKKCLNV
jgi:RNA polymerase sigma factor (sigma-70 family)